jgi:hypothetical protein
LELKARMIRNELSPERMMSLLTTRIGGTVKVLRGPLKGHSGKPFGLGRDGMAKIRIPWTDRPTVNIEVDWLDTDFGSPILRGSYRLRRRAIAVPQLALIAWSGVLPTRILNEDFGDYIEQVRVAQAEGRFVQLWRITCGAMFWTAINALTYIVCR